MELWIDDRYAHALRPALDEAGQHGGMLIWYEHGLHSIMIPERSLSVGVVDLSTAAESQPTREMLMTALGLVIDIFEASSVRMVPLARVIQMLKGIRGDES